MAINSGTRQRAQRWSQTIYAAYPSVHGLWYPSSMNANMPAVALYERAEFAIPEQPAFHRPLRDPGLLDVLAMASESLGYTLV